MPSGYMKRLGLKHSSKLLSGMGAAVRSFSWLADGASHVYYSELR